jgi:hypothetical protein
VCKQAAQVPVIFEPPCIIRLFQSSTCFEQTRANHQEVNCINTASGIVTLCKWPSGMQVEQTFGEVTSLFIMRLCGSMLPHNRIINNYVISPNVCSTCIPDGHLQRVTIPDAVLIQLTS